jgi:hypothetical protein
MKNYEKFFNLIQFIGLSKLVDILVIRGKVMTQKVFRIYFKVLTSTKCKLNTFREITSKYK